MEGRGEILIVDDEPDMLSLLRRTLSSDVDWEIHTAASAKEALRILGGAPIDVLLLDIKMPDMDGIDLLSHVKQEGEGPTVVMMTAYGVIELAVESMRKGAYDFVTKPFDNTRLMITLKKAMEYQRLRNENKELQRRICDGGALRRIVGRSPAMKRVFDMIRTVSRTDATVLITGESGTGKELVARSIHELSSRYTRPFVVVNCPTLPENILETELFGYVKGAFTDAKQDKKGLFQEANRGTIFLDEIGELPNSLQAKLLRVLQEKEIKPLGRSKSLKVDARVVASTNRNLRERMKAGKFREDLFYRLNVFSIELPPLRERGEDVSLLATYFLEKYSAEMGKEGVKFAPETLLALTGNPWSGNVRELENTIKRAIILAKGKRIRPQDVLAEPRDDCLVTHQEIHHLPYREAKKQVLATFNRQYLTQLLTQYQGNVTHAARGCGLERQALQQVIRRYGIKAEAFRRRP